MEDKIQTASLPDTGPVLLPCPFCGGKPSKVLGMKNGVRTVDIMCDDCSGSMPAFCEEDAFEDWNRRSCAAQGPDLAAEVERLRAGIKSIVNCDRPLTRSAVREACADILKATPAALGTAGAVERPPYPTGEADKKLAEDWYTWGFQAGLDSARCAPYLVSYDSEALSSPSQETRPDRGVAMTVREADIITGAMAIARSRGHDPDSEAPLTEMCTDDNCPVPWWMVFTEEAEACLTAVALAAVKNTDYEHEKLYVYDATSQTFDHSTSSMTLDEVRTVLKHHYLTAIHCDHKDSTDRAGCFCSTWYCEPQSSVGAAVDKWVEHVIEQLNPVSQTVRGSDDDR